MSIVTILAAWLHDLDPFVVRLSGDFGVRWYGLAYVAGFAAAWLILHLLARRGLLRLRPEAVGDLIFAIILGTVVGGRLGYVLVYRPSLLIEFTSTPPWWGLLAINAGGMASHGGMVGVVIATIWVARREQVPLAHLVDAECLVAPIGIFFGRIANFVNGELLGRIVAAPGKPAAWWAVRFPQELTDRPEDNELTINQVAELIPLLRTPPRIESLDAGWNDLMKQIVSEVQSGNAALASALEPMVSARHPSQIYQAAAEGLVLFVVLWAIWARPRKPGVITAWFGMIYGAGRIITEFWRLPDSHLAAGRVMGLSRGQWLSAALMLAGLVLLTIMLRRPQDKVGGWLTQSAAPADSRANKRC